MPYQYRKHERIKKNRDFLLTMKGKRLSGDGLSFFYTPNTIGYFRVGISISKKLGVAVKRNRLKRQLRACIGHALKNQTGGYDLVFVIRQALVGAGYRQMLKTVETTLFKSSLRIQKPEGTRNE